MQPSHFRPTWGEISREAFLHNLRTVRTCVGPALGIIAMVKADAYGHGVGPIAAWCADAQVNALGVATVEEGIEVRALGCTLPVIVMGGLMGQGATAARAAVQHDLTCVLHAADTIPLLAEAAAAAGRPVPCHLKIDTGMTRLGARPETVARLVERLQHAEALRLTGVMTHFAQVVDRDVTRQQAAQFCDAARHIRRAWRGPLLWHLGNSAAVLDYRHGMPPAEGPWCTPFPLAAGDQFWVRPGIMLYGIVPFDEYAASSLTPVMQLKSRVALLKHVPVGTRVSYSGTWTAARSTRLAVLPVGYADGYPWILANTGQVVIRGQRVPVVGRVTMDMIMCDVTDLATVAVGDEAVLLGTQGGHAIRAEEIARACQTIPYEIVCRIAKRVPRIVH